jgi:hypothetical protein
MRMHGLRINFYLLALVAAAACGCQTSKSKEPVTHIELHMETNPDGTERTQKILVNRTAPIRLTVNHEPFLDTRYLTNAAVVEALGVFSIQLDFDQQGRWMLESATSMNPGKRVAVLALFPEPRWLAAPLPQRRIANGRLTFTPDCSREEADRLVQGLHRSISKLKKK